MGKTIDNPKHTSFFYGMKIVFVFLLLGMSVVFSRAEWTVQLTEPLEEFLSEIAQQEDSGIDIHNIESMRFVLRKLRKHKFEDLSFFAKILLENKNRVLHTWAEWNLIMTLLNNTCGTVSAYGRHFEKTYEEKCYLEMQFHKSMRLTDPTYRLGF